jgi:hypothetical protein
MAIHNQHAKGRKAEEEYLWYGYGTYGIQPNVQLGGGLARDPQILEEFLRLLRGKRKSVVVPQKLGEAGK